MRVLGLDPGLRRTGWGVIEIDGAKLRFIAAGCIAAEVQETLAPRLAELHNAVMAITDQFTPDEVAIEETFVNVNPASTLKLGQARAAALLAPALRGLPVAEYSPTQVKKSVTGSGSAGKEQVQGMIATLLPGFRGMGGPDAADALATAICHAHHGATAARWAAALLRS